MKNDITIQLTKNEDFVAANKRRDDYALLRDLKALELNKAIAARMQSEIINQVKCEKCGKEFSAGITSKEFLICPECK